MKKRERQLIDGKWYTKPKRGKIRELTRCSNTLTESEFISLFIQALRQLTLRWAPRSEAWIRARKEVKEGRTKFKGQCASCKGWFARKDIEIDHINPIGNISKAIMEFADKVLPEANGWQCLCNECHSSKTHRSK